MIYAVPVVEEKVAAHFGHCSHFALFDVDEAAVVVMDKQIIPSARTSTRTSSRVAG